MSEIHKHRILDRGKVITITIVRQGDRTILYTRISKTLNLERSAAYKMNHYDKLIENQFIFETPSGMNFDQIRNLAKEIDQCCHAKL